MPTYFLRFMFVFPLCTRAGIRNADGRSSRLNWPLRDERVSRFVMPGLRRVNVVATRNRV